SSIPRAGCAWRSAMSRTHRTARPTCGRSCRLHDGSALSQVAGATGLCAAAPALAQAATILAEVKVRQRRERRCHRSKPCLDRPVLVLKMCGSIHPDAHPARRKGTPGAMKTLLSDKVLRRLVLGNLLVAGLL